MKNNWKRKMAGIDKTYTSSWKEYKELKEWLFGKYVPQRYSKPICALDFLYSYTEKDFKSLENGHELPVWNTPYYFDIWLIQNCPVKFIQDRLKTQYHDEYDKIKDGTSIFIQKKDRNGLGKKIRFSVLERPKLKIKDDLPWSIYIYDKDPVEGCWLYDEENDLWISEDDTCYQAFNCSYAYMRNFSLRKLYRKLKKWDLPKGLTVECEGRYFDQSYTLKTK